MSAKKRAYDALVAAGTNAVCNAGLCAGRLRGKTAVKCTLERKRGCYIMKQNLSNWSFRITNEHKRVLCDKSIKPLGYTLDGPFIF